MASKSAASPLSITTQGDRERRCSSESSRGTSLMATAKTSPRQRGSSIRLQLEGVDAPTLRHGNPWLSTQRLPGRPRNRRRRCRRGRTQPRQGDWPQARYVGRSDTSAPRRRRRVSPLATNSRSISATKSGFGCSLASAPDPERNIDGALASTNRRNACRRQFLRRPHIDEKAVAPPLRQKLRNLVRGQVKAESRPLDFGHKSGIDRHAWRL